MTLSTTLNDNIRYNNENFKLTDYELATQIKVKTSA